MANVGIDGPTLLKGVTPSHSRRPIQVQRIRYLLILDDNDSW